MYHSIGYLLVTSSLALHQGMHIPRLKVWKLREPNVKQEFARLVTRRKDEVFEADRVESKQNAMKEIWQKATDLVCSGQKEHRGMVNHGGGMMR